MPAGSVIDDLVEGRLNYSVNARFYAWVIGGSLPAALAGDWLTSTWDQNAALYSVSPASAIIEEAVGSWLKDLFRFAEIAAEGTSFFSGTTTTDGRRAMRISVSNWQTSFEDLSKSIAGVERVLTQMRRSAGVL